ENHPDTADSLNNLAELYRNNGRYSEAIPLLERWKDIQRERQETRNQSYAERIWTLGRLYEKCQQFPEAIATYKEALSIFDHFLDPKHPRRLLLKSDLGRLKKNMKKVKKAGLEH
ncbi:tetratricopeptide repeat protein, partial [Anabaena sp. PCC 7938]|uniref:tetratricopeptide repeat protein n=1 Tax=Anabaena sp. PCC 7938 TaxID=1296340 RepID=UPI001DE17D8A